jgi:hypothetical protein
MALFVPVFSFRHSVPAANSRVKNFEHLIYHLRFSVLARNHECHLLRDEERFCLESVIVRLSSLANSVSVLAKIFSGFSCYFIGSMGKIIASLLGNKT